MHHDAQRTPAFKQRFTVVDAAHGKGVIAQLMLEFLAQGVRLTKPSDLFPISRAQLREESVVF